MRSKPVYLTDVKDYGKEVVDSAFSLLERYKGSYILGIGSSPSYLIYAAQEIQNAMGLAGQKLFCIPFTGSYCEISSNHQDITLTKINLTDQDIEAYYQQIKAYGVDLAKIISDSNKIGKPLIVVDYVDKGHSILSFVYILEKIAAKNNIKLNLEVANMSFPIDFYSIFDKPGGIIIGETRYARNPIKIDLLNDKMTTTNQRYIPPFQIDKWYDNGYINGWDLRNEKYKDGRPVSPKTHEGPTQIKQKISNKIDETVSVCDTIDNMVNAVDKSGNSGQNVQNVYANIAANNKKRFQKF